MVVAPELVNDEEVVHAPRLFWKVIYLNDDFTPMNFVVEIIVNLFNKQFDEAYMMMQKIHNDGFAVIHVYSREIAEQKVHETIQLARMNDFPLMAIAEPE